MVGWLDCTKMVDENLFDLSRHVFPALRVGLLLNLSDPFPFPQFDEALMVTPVRPAAFKNRSIGKALVRTPRAMCIAPPPCPYGDASPRIALKSVSVRRRHKTSLAMTPPAGELRVSLSNTSLIMPSSLAKSRERIPRHKRTSMPSHSAASSDFNNASLLTSCIGASCSDPVFASSWE